MVAMKTNDGTEFRVKGDEPYFAEERPGWKGYVEWEVSAKCSYTVNTSSSSSPIEISREERGS